VTLWDLVSGLCGRISVLDELCMQSLRFVAKCLHHNSALIRFSMSYRIIFAAGVLVMGMIVAFCSAGYNFITCDFTAGVVNMNKLIRQYCHRAVSVM